MNAKTKDKLVWDAIPTLFDVSNPPPMENCMSNNVAAILNSDMTAPYDENVHIVHIFLGIKSLYFPSKVQ